MSILNKLKELVSLIEESDTTVSPASTTPGSLTPEEPSDENTGAGIVDLEEELEEELEEAPSDAEPETPKTITCTEGESLEIRVMVLKEKFFYSQLGVLLRNYETQKETLFKDLKLNNELYMDQLELLRQEYGVPKTGYEIQLPSDNEGLLSFVKVEKKV